MVIKQLTGKFKEIVLKYRYAALVLVIGLILIMLPGKNEKKSISEDSTPADKSMQTIQVEALADILQAVHGAGRVQVLLSVATGEQTIYQTNTDTSTSGDGTQAQIETVVITDAQRNEAGLINQINPPKYLGAIVVCEGADSANVRLAVTQAVAKITGLGTDAICVLKMK